MQTFEIEGQTDQTPFASDGGQAAQGELAKAQDFFDDAEHRLDRAFAQAINGLADLSLQFVSHLDFGGDAVLPVVLAYLAAERTM